MRRTARGKVSICSECRFRKKVLPDRNVYYVENLSVIVKINIDQLAQHFHLNVKFGIQHFKHCKQVRLIKSPQ